MRLPQVLFAVILSSLSAFATTTPPQMLLGVPQPVAGTEFTMDVIVENVANASPAATGTVSVNFGDGSSAAMATLTNSLVTVQHTYAAAGPFTITASYSGDSNFSPATSTHQAVVLSQAPPAVTLRTFGDSITAGTGNSSPSTAYVSVLTATEGWGLDDLAQGGDTVIDQCAVIYGVTVVPGDYSTLLIGQNEASLVGYPTNGGAPEYEGALTACSAWLSLTPDSSHGAPTKVIAQDAQVTRTGTWQNSTLFTAMGLMSTTAGSSLTVPLAGNMLYLNLTSTESTNYTVSVTVDGQSAGTYSPVLTYEEFVDYGPYGIRLPATGIGPHTVTVTCTDPGTSGCFVDWFGGNALPAALPRPRLWLGTPYLTNQGIPAFVYDNVAADVEGVQSGLASDGLSVGLADVHNYFSGPVDPQCMYDKVHPSDCGHALLAATFLGSINFPVATTTTLTATPNPASVGQNVTLSSTVTNAVGAAAPTGSVSFYYGSLLLNTANISNGVASYTASTKGLPAENYTITAIYSGDSANATSAATPLTVKLNKIATTTVLSASPNPVSVGQTVQLSATVSRASGTGEPTGTVTFYYKTTVLGHASLNGDGVATLTAPTTGLIPGTYKITAVYSGDSADAASTAPAYSVVLNSGS